MPSTLAPPQTETASNIIQAGCQHYLQGFQTLTKQVQPLFEQAAWADIHNLSQQRLDSYKECLLLTIDQLKQAFKADSNQVLDQQNFWQACKQHYAEQIKDSQTEEIEQTYFNSIYCYWFDHHHLNDQSIFISSQFTLPECQTSNIVQRFSLDQSLHQLITHVLNMAHFDLPFEDQARDIRNIVNTVKRQLLPFIKTPREQVQVEVLTSLFYRNKATYIVGRILDGQQTIPFVLPILNNEQGGLYIDTLILDSSDVSIIFSFTRSYFLVEAPIPSEMVSFLQKLMPQKGLAELYNAIGLNKHGKTEFYRSFVEHLEHSDDEFILAPGIKGMVMSVFTLPSYDIVFKVIKDRFDPPKDMSRNTVKEKYRLVSRHDRVGRMADTQEYSYFRFPKKRFSKELIEELQKVAPSILEFTDDEIIIEHLYSERKMVPLNLYLGYATEQQTDEVMDEYGNAIKQIASSNIFPGDMLLKNFGVTRHGRVVFYDYDEICFLDECRFRIIPEPKTEEQAMSSTPWYSVGQNDIFPEEFRLFFTGNPTAKRLFEKHHSDLYEANFWQQLQKNIVEGKVEDMFPYRRKKRFLR